MLLRGFNYVVDGSQPMEVNWTLYKPLKKTKPLKAVDLQHHYVSEKNPHSFHWTGFSYYNNTQLLFFSKC